MLFDHGPVLALNKSINLFYWVSGWFIKAFNKAYSFVNHLGTHIERFELYRKHVLDIPQVNDDGNLLDNIAWVVADAMETTEH